MLRAQHGDEAIAEIEESDRIAIAEDVTVVALQAIGFDVRGLAQLNAAAEQAATAPWLKRFNENGVKVVRVFKMNGQWWRWREPTHEELENGVFFANADEYQRAQRGGYVPKDNQNDEEASWP